MGKHIIEDPLETGVFKADGSGRVTLGADYKDSEVRVVVEEIINDN